MKEGDDVIYEGRESGIEEIKGNEARISNPAWQDIANECGDLDADESVPYWIWIKLDELTLLKLD